jgi:hypothetical protein
MTHFHIVDSWRYSRYEVPWESATGATFLLYIRGIRRFCVHISQTENFLSKVFRLFLFINTQERTDNLIFILSYHWIHITVHDRVDRVLGFFTSRPNWDYPTPSQQTSLSPPPVGSGGHTRLRKRGWEGSQFRRGGRRCGTVLVCSLFLRVDLNRKGDCLDPSPKLSSPGTKMSR